jgi:hypothetical protein
MLRRGRTDVLVVVVVGAVLIGFAGRASAQPYIPAAGEGTVSLAYHSIFTHGQHDTFGTQEAAPGGPREGTDSNVLLWYVEYGLTDRFAVHASLPFIQTRYQGCCAHTTGIKGQPSNLDDGRYHGAFQDFYFGSRFKLFESPRFAVTPFVETIIPSHQYESLAQSAVGRDLRALVTGVAIGGFLDNLLPGLNFQTRLSYAFSEKAVDIRPNRSGIDSAIGYFVTPRFGIQFLQTFQYTYDGIEWLPAPDYGFALHNKGPLDFSKQTNWPYGFNHDRLARSNALTFGGGASFALTQNVGVFGTATKLAWGENLAAPRSLTVGLNWSFKTRRAASRPNPNVKR